MGTTSSWSSTSPTVTRRRRRPASFAFTNLGRGIWSWGFPTVVLADADGLPYAIWTGYLSGDWRDAGSGDDQAVQTARTLRDRNFRLATATTGRERAEHLHQGITAVAGLPGSLDDRGDDPVLVFYKPQVEEIRKADGDGNGEGVGLV